MLSKFKSMEGLEMVTKISKIADLFLALSGSGLKVMVKIKKMVKITA